MNLYDLLREVSEAKATDLYLAAGALPCMNMDGVMYGLRSAGGNRLAPQQTEDFAREVMTDSQWEDFQTKREANLAYMADNIGRFRVNMFWQRGTVAMVLRRVIMKIPTLRALGLPPFLRNISLEENGIVLVTGSTGSGKSTTMASMLDYRNHVRTGHIVTIEDPIEFVYRHRRSIVTQREVGIDTYSFHEALKNTLRQAPQVICLGELRDAETVQFAMHAAETGHLVFATLHSTDVVVTIERVLNFYSSEMRDQIRQQLAMNLRAIICQRLIPRVDGRGRVPAMELLMNIPTMQEHISRGDMSVLRMAMNRENNEGIQSFDKHLYQLFRMGYISQDEALAWAVSANDLQMKFRGIGVPASWEEIGNPWEGVGGDYDMPKEITRYGRQEARQQGSSDRIQVGAGSQAPRQGSQSPQQGQSSSASGLHDFRKLDR